VTEPKVQQVLQAKLELQEQLVLMVPKVLLVFKDIKVMQVKPVKQELLEPKVLQELRVTKVTQVMPE
tara:strand:- start:16 stop:216 length:201 start_codon:yes stop_codon:yes gene_type:complete